MARSKMSRRNSQVESAADFDLRSHVAVGLICSRVIFKAPTFLWLSGNGHRSQVVDDVVKRPSLLYVLLQHRHAVLDENLDQRENQLYWTIGYPNWGGKKSQKHQFFQD